MTTYRFSAATIDNRLEEGQIAASDDAHAMKLLLDRGLYPLEIRAASSPLRSLLSKRIGMASLSRAEAAQLLSDLGHLVSTGIEVAAALALVGQTASSRRAKDVVVALQERVRSGQLLSEATTAQPKSIASHIPALIRAGEVANTLGEVLVATGESERRLLAMRSQARIAMIYPACVAVAVSTAIFVLLVAVVPTLEELFSGQSGRLPWQTQALIGVGRALRENLLALLAIGVVCAGGFTVAARSPRGRLVLETHALRTPVIGEMLRASETAQLATLLAAFIRARMPLVTAMSLTQDGARLSVSREALRVATVKLRQGRKLGESLADVPTLSPRMIALVNIGEATGRLDVLLHEAARDAERALTTTLNRLLALLTPVMTIFFGLIAGFVLYAVMTAILSVNDFALGG